MRNTIQLGFRLNPNEKKNEEKQKINNGKINLIIGMYDGERSNSSYEWTHIVQQTYAHAKTHITFYETSLTDVGSYRI